MFYNVSWINGFSTDCSIKCLYDMEPPIFYYLRQGDYVLKAILSSLSVSRITQKLLVQFSWNLVEGCSRGQGRTLLHFERIRLPGRLNLVSLSLTLQDGLDGGLHSPSTLLVNLPTCCVCVSSRMKRLWIKGQGQEIIVIFWDTARLGIWPWQRSALFECH